MRHLVTRLTRPRRDDGATAIMVALLALVLIGAGALAVDIGQVMAKRAALQSNVDHAVMAAAAQLNNSGPRNQAVVDTATEYLTKATNQVPDQVAIDLGDGDLSTGHIECANWKVDLWAPVSNVSWGMARAVTGSEGVDVPAHAAAQIKSPASAGTLPMYAVAGCDFGPQQITDPPPGQGGGGGSSPPPLTPTSTNNYNDRFTISPTEVDGETPTPVPMTLTAATTGNPDLSTVQAVGFTKATGEHYTATPSSPPTTSQVQIATVPAEVLAEEGIWWVRLWDGTRWSRNDYAQSFVVGGLLFCGGAVSGNFGTLHIGRNDTQPSNYLALNIIKGPQPQLATYSGSETHCANQSPWITSDRPQEYPASSTGWNDGTNCVSTDPGFPGQVATDGFISGAGGEPGRLNAPTTPGCDRNGGSNKTVATPGNGPTLNDDHLRCFLISNSYSVADVIAGEPGVLSADILESPRFFRIPVIPVQAEQGTSNMYPIIAFRAGFITNEPSGTSGSWNGIEIPSGNKVQQINVVLFPDSALPETAPPVGGEIDFTGSGTRVIVMVE
jgi:hypothetical protein